MKENFEKQLVDKLVDKINSQKDEILIEGLRLKGYEFSNDVELIDFIKKNCEAMQRNNNGTFETTYYAKGEAFLYIESNPIEPLECNFNWDNFEQKMIIQGDRYKFL